MSLIGVAIETKQRVKRMKRLQIPKNKRNFEILRVRFIICSKFTVWVPASGRHGRIGFSEYLILFVKKKKFHFRTNVLNLQYL